MKDTSETSSHEVPDRQAYFYVGATISLLAISVASVKLAQGEADCVQPVNDILPAISVTDCLEDLFE